MRAIWSTALLFLMAACGSEQFDEKSLPDAMGSPGELVVVCDDAIWKGMSGDQIRKAYGAEQPGLPQPEPWFKLIRFDEGSFSDISQRYRNILFVTSLDNDSKTSRFIKELLGEKQYSQQLTDTTFLFVESQNRWARGQQVMYVIGKSDRALAEAVKRKKEDLRNYLNARELNRVVAAIKLKARNSKAEKIIADSCGIQMYVPKSYQLRVAEPGFVWIVREDDEKALNLFISIRPYTSEAQFTAANVLAFRDSLTKERIPGPTKGSYYTTEYLLPPDTTVTIMNDQYALKLRGLWRVENDFMGGPFIHTTGLNTRTNQLVSLEGFVYFPKEKKRELLRELEAIMATVTAK